jgi:hypothetical protein
VTQAFDKFGSPTNITIKQLKANNLSNWRNTSAELLTWYRSWRQHGQMYRRWDKRDHRWIQISDQQQNENRSQPGFQYARRDHNEGLDVQGTCAVHPDPENPKGRQGETFRPALGLPIIQYFSSLQDNRGQQLSRGRSTVNWEWSQDGGRFASPVILRPHKDSQGNWHALVIFVDAMKWPAGKKVHLNGHERNVSLDLYEAMKTDKSLTSFL